ncbi:MAG: DUF3667 domain-containing protein [Alistipes sp.]
MESPKICRNCGEAVTGCFCPNCGQSIQEQRLKWRSLADSFMSTFFGNGVIGARGQNAHYGLIETLWVLIFRPGRTIREYIEGHRNKYFNPISLLLLLSGLYVLLSSSLGLEWSSSMEPNSEFIERLTYTILYYFSNHPASWLLFLLPFKALTNKWIFHKNSNLNYVEYIYLGVFLAIFSILMLLLVKIPILYWSGAADGWHMIYDCVQLVFDIIVYHSLFHITWVKSIFSWLKTTVFSYLLLLITTIFLLVFCMGIFYLVADLETFDRLFPKEETTDYNTGQGIISSPLMKNTNSSVPSFSFEDFAKDFAAPEQEQ